jgi:predicted MFS family arabinose efflux permease
MDRSKVLGRVGFAVAMLLVAIISGRVFDRWPQVFLPLMAAVGGLLVVLLVVQWLQRRQHRQRP